MTLFSNQKNRSYRTPAAIAALILTLGAFLFWMKPFDRVERLSFPEFAAHLEAGAVKEVRLVGLNMLKSRLEGRITNARGVQVSFVAPVLLQYQNDLKELLAEHGFPFVEQAAGGSRISGSDIFTIGLILMLGLFMAQTLGVIDITPSQGKKVRPVKVTFADVAGIDDAKEEIMEVVNLIKERSHITDLGGSIPKGILLVGPPGTGKTMLAKAIATEASVPFFEISGSSFVEKYVGVGASRVRSLFKQARHHAPCIIFVDELDAVGGTRSDSVEGAAREHNQTLNALLVEMDGCSGREGVIVVGATNRRESLDPALLRPGRFDRLLSIGLPDVKGREEILQVHSRAMKLSPEVDLREVARGTSGFSGAELASLLNESALIAGRRRAGLISHSDLENARDRIMLGTERTGTRLNEKEKWLTAYHEAGHAIVNHFVPNGQKLHRVTIIPRGGALGVTMMLPEEMKYGETRLKLLDMICVLMGGRAAEDVFLGDVSSGASGDIAMATRYAKKMVCEWGMSARVGMVRFDGRSDDYLPSRGTSAREVENEIAKLIRGEYGRALALIQTYQEEVQLLARELFERESLSAAEVDALLEGSPDRA